jgi:MFS family permease
VSQLPKAPAEKPKIEVGTVAALGVGLGAISTMIGGALAGFVNLGWWMPLGVLGLVMLVSGPSMLIAWLKLRQRTLGPILEGTGWAINGRVKINIPLGSYLTDAKELPLGSKRILGDPFSDEKEKQRQRNITIAVTIALIFIALVWWQFDWLKSQYHAYFGPAKSVVETTTVSPAATTTTTTTTTTPAVTVPAAPTTPAPEAAKPTTPKP